MSWKDRLRKGITLLSPEGNRFDAYWRGDDITVSKRINRIAHPDQDGESAQDMGTNSPDIPLTIYFTGADHDQEAFRFWRAIAERGAWQVIHPVYGLMRLQPVKITLRVQPVESGNITEISGDWFEPYLEGTAAGQSAAAAISAASAIPFPVFDPAATVQSAVQALSEAAQADALQITQDTAARIQSAARQFKQGLKAAADTIKNADARVTGIMGTINDLTNEAYMDIAALSGAVIQLVESPGLFIGNTASKVSMFVTLGRRILTDLPAALNFSASKINAALTGELWLNAMLCGMSLSVTEILPETRAEALSILRQYRQFAAQSCDALDALAKATAGLSIEDQYFPRATSAEAVLTLNAAVARYVQTIAFDLKTEKRIVLQRPTSPLLLAIREYNATAQNADYYFDLLARSNDLHGLELLLLDRQREVVVYQ